MKLIAAITFISGCLAFCTCNKETPYHEVVYFSDIDSNPVKELVVLGNGTASEDLSVTSSDKTNQDMVVSIASNPGLIEAYKEYTGKKNVSVLPESNYTLSTNQVTIKSGTNKSGNIKVTITSTDGLKEGVKYCLPLEITDVSSQDFKILQPSKIVYVAIVQGIVTKAIDMGGRAYVVEKFQTDASMKALTGLTMECRLYVRGFVRTSRNVMGIGWNWFMRFGDVSIDDNVLQVGPAKISGSTYFVTTKTRFTANKWYHVAVTYNGSSVTFYINGVADVSQSVPQGTIDFTDKYDGGFLLGSTGSMNGYMSEVRVWNRALSSAELQDGVCYVDPKSEGLIAWWRMNAVQEDGSVKDETGHGYDAKPYIRSPITWVENLQCP